MGVSRFLASAKVSKRVARGTGMDPGCVQQDHGRQAADGKGADKQDAVVGGGGERAAAKNRAAGVECEREERGGGTGCAVARVGAYSSWRFVAAGDRTTAGAAA